ncbi:MAG: NAD(P)/FAD-dependent oxidoreductase [Lachnospiraceae bacterium]|jgi:glycerol-3-phosphate dehydrogenase
MNKLYDVIIIGGGVVGSAIARELSRFRLSLAVLEKNPDVCFETSGRNTGVCHGGFAYDTGSLKAKFCVAGNRMMGRLSRELDFAFQRTGKVLVGNTQEEWEQLKRVKRQGMANGVTGLELIDGARLHELVPAVKGSFALYSPNSGILDPFGFTIALAENAHANGCEYYLESPVTDIRKDSDGNWLLVTPKGTFATRWVVNAAGLGCKEISDMLGITGYHVIGSKDDYIVLDKQAGQLVPMPIYTVPSNTYMGIHVTITTSGNVLLGPTAENTDNLSWYGTEQKNLDYLYGEAQKIWPHVKRSDYIRTYSGILPKLIDENGDIQDFRIEIRDDIAPRAVNLVGIESPGLTSSVPLAQYVVEMIRERERLEEKDFCPGRRAPRRFALCTPQEQEELIAQNPDYGELVCRCEKVSRAEILQAIHNPLGARTMASVKFRTRAMMGRCQGGYCQMRIEQMLEQELGLTGPEVTYERTGSHPILRNVREE